jgi:multiple sugar transport system substrate-binding protein
MKKNRVMKGLALVVATGLLGGLAACSSSSGGDEGTADNPVTITFWDNNGGPDRTPLYQDIISKFEAQNPSIKVDYVGIPASDAATKYQTAVAGGSTPDVGIVVGWMASSLAAQNALTPLDDMLASSDLNGHIADDALTAAHGSSFDHKLYILPMTATPDTIWYRSDQFAAAGVTPPDTWADFYAAAKALTNTSTGEYGFAMRGGAGSVNQLVPVAYSCSAIDSFFDSNDKTTLSDPKIGSCLQQFADIYNVDTSQADVSYAYQDMITAFDSGKAAMVQHNLGSAANHVKAFGEGVAVAAPMPAATDSGARTLVAPTPEGPAVFSGSQHPEAAWKFAQFLLSHDINSQWNQTTNQIPGNSDARADSWVAGNQPISVSIDALGDSANTIVTSPLYLPDWNSILTDMAQEWQAVLLKQTTAQQFADDWADKVNTAEAEYQDQFGGK